MRAATRSASSRLHSSRWTFCLMASSLTDRCNLLALQARRLLQEVGGCVVVVSTTRPAVAGYTYFVADRGRLFRGCSATHTKAPSANSARDDRRTLTHRLGRYIVSILLSQTGHFPMRSWPRRLITLARELFVLPADNFARLSETGPWLAICLVRHSRVIGYPPSPLPLTSRSDECGPAFSKRGRLVAGCNCRI
jgi:hypothetical protein